MSVITEYGLDSPARALLILVLSLKNREPMSKLHFQKAILYFERMQKQNDIDFSDFHYGGVSYELQESLEALEEYGYMLTEEGEMTAGELVKQYDKEALRRLVFAKQQLNDLPDKELLYLMYKLFPDTQANSTEYKKLEEEKQTIIPKLFLKGRITAHMAAEWLGISERAFLESLSRKE
jgi:predicted HTH domain antitoxin